MPDGAKIAHMYPGQGSQYVGMTFDLHRRYAPVQDVWAASDSTMVEVLDGETLSSFVLRDGLKDDERKAAEHKLKQTEYTQPAMLTADLAIEHALNAYGHRPDMVAGHSLGEYAALMASGILNMDGALRAAAARGTEMGSVEIDDKGLMASVTAPYDAVERILDAAEGYVIAANKNSPKTLFLTRSRVFGAFSLHFSRSQIIFCFSVSIQKCLNQKKIIFWISVSSLNRKKIISSF